MLKKQYMSVSFTRVRPGTMFLPSLGVMHLKIKF